MRHSLLKKIAAVLLLLLSVWTLSAQQKVTITGVVVDEQNQPMIAAGVVQKGSTNGTITDLDGNFTITVPAGTTLEISSVGYFPQEIIATKTETVNIKLLVDTQMIEETVVVGYGVQRKSDLTGAISQVKSEDLQNRTVTDAAQALSGKMAGIQTFSASAKPGATPTIRVRGISSNGSSDPLYVVDGRLTNSIAGIDPNDIESMEVLKDAASAAIYGAQAGNGVILITTRRGQGDGKITYSYQLASQYLGKMPKMMNSEQYAQYYIERERISLDYLYNNWDFKTNTDWLDYSYGSSLMQHHNVTFSASNDRGNLYVSGSYLDNDGMLRGDADVYSRITGMINGSWKFKPWLELQSNNQIEYYRSRSVSENNDYGSTILATLQLDPLTPPTYTPDALPEFMRQYLAQGKTLLQNEKGDYYAISRFNFSENVNPMVSRDGSYAISKGFNLNGSTSMNIKPFRELTITSRIGYRLSANDSYSYVNDYFYSEMVHSDFMQVNASTGDSIYYQWENFANWTHSFGKHNVNVMLGTSFSEHRSFSTNAGISGHKDGDKIDFGVMQDNPLFYYIPYATGGATKTVGGGVENLSRKLSYFGRASWNYQGRYYIQASVRADAADLAVLPRANRWIYVPSVSTGWNVSEENFFAGMKAYIPYLKLRASWGSNGSLASLGGYAYSNDVASIGRYPTGVLLSSGAYEYINAYAPTATGNPELKWETSEQIDLGIDMRFFNDRLSVGFDWFDKKTKDLIVSGITPSTVVGVSASPVNAGNVENRGIELELRWKDQIGDFFYRVGANLSTLRNRVTFLHPTLKDGLPGATIRNYGTITRFEIGYPAWHYYGYEFAGINEENGEALFHLNTPVKDASGKEVYVSNTPAEADRRDLGSGIPTYTFGLTLNAAWKGFDALVFVSGAGGHKIFNGLSNIDYSSNRLTVFTEDRWTPSNKKGTMPAANATNWTQFLTSSGTMFDGSFVKVKQIQLGYTIPHNMTNKIALDSFRIYGALDDWFTFSKYPGFDPEVTGVGNAIGVDKGTYPSAKKLVLGVNVTF